MTDTINEYFGRRGVRFISWLAAALIVYGFVFAFIAIRLAPAAWWTGIAADQGVPDYQAAFAAVFGQGLWTRSEEHTSELQSLMRISYAVFCLKTHTDVYDHKTTD